MGDWGKGHSCDREQYRQSHGAETQVHPVPALLWDPIHSLRFQPGKGITAHQRDCAQLLEYRDGWLCFGLSCKSGIPTTRSFLADAGAGL